jgi:hypothetical protein
MSAEERLESGIWQALLDRPAHIIEDTPGSYRSVDHRIAEDNILEEFFARESVHAGIAIGAGSILILCGDMHASFLQQIMEATEQRVEVDRSLIPRRYWQ